MFSEDTTEIVVKYRMIFHPSLLPADLVFLLLSFTHSCYTRSQEQVKGCHFIFLNREAQQVNLCIGIWTYSWQIHQSRWESYESRCVLKKKKNLSWHTDQYFSNVTNIERFMLVWHYCSSVMTYRIFEINIINSIN